MPRAIPQDQGHTALHNWATTIEDQQVFDVAVEGLLPSPSQTREDFSHVPEMARSITANGQKTPIQVWRRPDGKIQIVAGECRVRAMKELGRRTIRAVFVHGSSRQRAILCGIENLHRRQLNPLEEAKYFVFLRDKEGMSIAEISESLGRDSFTVESFLAVVDVLPENVLELVKARELAITPAYSKLVKPLRAGKLKPEELYAKAREIVNRKRGGLTAEQRAREGSLSGEAGPRAPRAASEPMDRLRSILSLRERGNKTRASVEKTLELSRPEYGLEATRQLLDRELSPETRQAVGEDFRWLSKAAGELAFLFDPPVPVPGAAPIGVRRPTAEVLAERAAGIGLDQPAPPPQAPPPRPRQAPVPQRRPTPVTKPGEAGKRRTPQMATPRADPLKDIRVVRIGGDGRVK